ncbi:hypothetical protein FOMPIDRAFT_1016559 [Fomitopsis schrenkii]|uniref:Uncharacterized protein n=1 Tax=Fomitopsis schrenkii TaxID=2126942 RepID=S8E5C2_FOMSC|nr:hypothetical protein FOMPIDRAFT_1016559 [Fomitopsis schrenkii]
MTTSATLGNPERQNEPMNTVRAFSPVILGPRSQKKTGADELARPRMLDAPVFGRGAGELAVEVDDPTATAELYETSSVVELDNIAMEDVRATRIEYSADAIFAECAKRDGCSWAGTEESYRRAPGSYMQRPAAAQSNGAT